MWMNSSSAAFRSGSDPAGRLRAGARTVSRTLAFVTAILGAALLASCGPSPAVESSGTPVEITWFLQLDVHREFLEGRVREFERAHPAIRVKILWVPGSQYATKLKTLIAAGQAPDMFNCGDALVAYFKPFLFDLTAFVARDGAEVNLDDFDPQLLKACQHDGRFFFLPRSFNVSLLYYNRALFDQAGVAYPTRIGRGMTTRARGGALTHRNPDGTVATWGSTIQSFWWGEWLILVRQAGGEVFNEGMTSCTLNTAEAKRGMRFYWDKVWTSKIAPPPGQGPDNGFASGKIAMEFGGHTGNWLGYNEMPGLKWDVEILPKGPATRRGGEIAIDAIGVSKSTRHPDAAWEFVKFMSSPESVREHVKRGYVAVRKSVAEETLRSRPPGSQPQNMAAVYEALKDGVPIPRSPDYVEMALEIVQPDLDEMMARGTDPRPSLRQGCRLGQRVHPDRQRGGPALKRKTLLWFLIMTGPALVGFVLLTLVPMAISIYLSLTKYDIANPPVFVGFRNYVYLLKCDPAFWPAVTVTTIYSIATVPLTLAASLLVALLLNNPIRYRGVFRTIFFLPSLLPATASAIVWVYVFHPSYGLLNMLLAKAGIAGPAWTQSPTWALPLPDHHGGVGVRRAP